jgi:TPR repeat protein
MKLNFQPYSALFSVSALAISIMTGLTASPSEAAESAEFLQEKALCDKGYPNGCSNEGQMLWQGDGVAENRVKGAALFKMACSKKVYIACYNLGMAYSTDRGIGMDEGKAAQYFTIACKGGYDRACSRVGEPDSYTELDAVIARRAREKAECVRMHPRNSEWVCM